MTPSGYSGTPLAKKLGIKEGFIIRLIHPPDDYFGLFTDMPEGITLSTDTKTKKNFIHLFARGAKEIQDTIVLLRNEIREDGTIWISWYKKSSGIPTDVTETFIRETAPANGLVDVKVCAVDEFWSGLKLVIPLKNRIQYKKQDSIKKNREKARHLLTKACFEQT